MNKLLLILILFTTSVSCQKVDVTNDLLVKNADELKQAFSNAKPGDHIIMANGEWKDINIRFTGEGTENQPITLEAETPGKVMITGESSLRFGGEYLVVSGLYFTDGFSPSSAVIDFALNDETVANHCRVTNCVIKDFNKPQRNMTDLWVRFRGRHNQLDQCYITGKANRGPTVRVDLAGNESIKNYHKINNNHFGPRPPKGGPSAETIQLGNSFTSMAPSHTLVSNNFFERCNGEVEIISSKTNFNEFRNNVFYKSEGSLVTRHGNYCAVDGNYFIGDDNSDQIGGVRLIGTGHWVTNNYFYNLKGQIFRSPLAVMNGIPKSPLNRYIQVTDVVVAYNTWVDCVSPLQFGVGSNVDQRGILPDSEIRSARPIRTLLANNLIVNSEGDNLPVVAHDKLDGINFQSNVIDNNDVAFKDIEGLSVKNVPLSELEENVFVPTSGLSDVEPYVGFEFDQIKTDLFGNSREKTNSIGATNGASSQKPNIMDLSQYGTDWFNPTSQNEETTKHSVATSTELVDAINKSQNGDIIELTAASYELSTSLKIGKMLTIKSADTEKKSSILFKGEAGVPAFEMNPKGQLVLESVKLMGNKKNYAFASLTENMSSLYNLEVKNCEISNFDFVLKAYKFSFSEHIKFISTVIEDCNNGLELSAEDDDKGDYNAENILISDCTFKNVDKNVLDYYRGGYDESTVGGNLIVKGSTFTGCGKKEKNGILLNTYGIINVKILDNTFINNRVSQVAQLWGAKNNTHSGNEISKSGKIVVEENLKLKLMY